jgi:hypothetical protein
MRGKSMLALALLVVCFVAGCKSQPQMSNTPQTGLMQEPLWVTKPASAFPDEMGKTFFAVGIASGKISDISARTTTATERGRRALAAQLNTMVSSVFKDYQKSSFSKEMDEGGMDSVTEIVTKNVTDATLIGSERRDLWTNPATGDMYVLMTLSSDSIAKNLRDEIINAEKDRLNKDADAAHKELDTIIEKYRQQPPK